VVAQHGLSDLRRDRLRFTLPLARGALIFRKALERRACGLRLALSDQPYHFEKQRQRAWRAFMLQRTMLR
jgi:hypothetical protein